MFSLNNDIGTRNTLYVVITEIVCCGGFNLLKRHGSVTVCHNSYGNCR